MAALTPTALRLLVVPDRRVLLSTSGVSMTATSEAGPRPGVMAPVGTPTAVYQASGTLDSELTDLTFAVAQSGGIGAGALRWQHAGEGMRNWDPPSAVSEFQFIDRSIVAGKYRAPHACRLTSGLVVVVVTDADTGITCFRQAATGLWSSSTVATVATSRASVAQLPTGRLVCVYTAGGTTTTQIKMSYSDDGGATWTLGNPACLATPIAQLVTAFTRIRVGVMGSDLLILLYGGTPRCYQYASSDSGATFAVVEENFAWPGATIHQPDISCRGGVAYIGAIYAIPIQPAFAVLTTARTKLSGVTPTLCLPAGDPLMSGAAAVGDLAILADDDGTLWMYVTDTATAATRETVVLVSIDGGTTWLRPWRSSANANRLNIASWGVAASYLIDFCVVPERGRAVLISTSVAAASPSDDSLLACYLGGWSTISLPRDADYARMADVGGWDNIYLPIEQPADIGWVRTVTGTPGQQLTANGLQTTMIAGERQVYSRTVSIAAAPNAGILRTGQVQVNTGEHSDEIAISDGVNGYRVRLDITATELRLFDVILGAYIGLGEATTAAATGVAYLICVDAPQGYIVGAGRVRAYYRASGNTSLAGPKADRQWTLLKDFDNLTRAPLTTASVTWGQTAVAAGVATWRSCAYSGGLYVAGRNGLADPVRGRVTPDRTSPVHIEKGLRLACTAGSAFFAKQWKHTTDHDYPVEAVDVSFAPSPSRTWRSTSDTSQQDIVWTIDGGWRAGTLVALYLGGCNFRSATLWRDTTATNRVMDIDLGFSGLDYLRTRNMLTPANSGTALPWHIREGAIDGASVVLTAGAVTRKIRHARGGMWPAVAGTFPLAELELESYAAGDPASGSGELWLQNGLFITTILVSTDRLMLRIPAARTAAGYHEVGVAMIGRAAVLGRDYDWGRGDEVLTSVDVTELRGGGRRAHQRAKNRRAIEVNWSNSPVDSTGLYTATAPDHVSAYTGGPAHAVAPATLPLMAGLLGEIKGAKLPAVLCMRMPTQASAPTALAPIRVLDPEVLMYGRITTDTWRRDNVLGEEGADPGEVVRGGTIRMEEEL